MDGQTRRNCFALWTALLMSGLPLSGLAQFTFTTNADSTLTITDYAGSGGSVTIPSTNSGYPVTVIGTNAFYGKTTVTNVIIPNSIISIGDYAFYGCSGLTNVMIPNSVLSIGNVAFYGSSAANVVIPDSVTNVGDLAFGGCPALTNVVIGSGVSSIGAVAFSSKNLVNIVVDEANPTYASLAGVLFDKARTTLIQYPRSLPGDYTVPDSVLSIGDNSFTSSRSLKSVMIPNSVLSIGYQAFYFCTGLTNVIIGNSLTNIGFYAFSNCTNLTSIVIPNSVTGIGDDAFYSCSGLHQVFLGGDAPSSGIGIFTPETVTVYYLPGTTGWDTTFGARPTVLWNPKMQTSDSNFGIQTNRFGFNLTGTTNIPVVIEATTNLRGVWTPLLSGTITNGSIYFADPQWTNYPQRFYRVRSP